MSLFRNLATTAALTAAVGGVFVASSPAAHAAGGTAPACVARGVDYDPAGFFVHLTNNCTRTMRVQVIVRLGSDSPCYSMQRGTSKTFWHGGIGAYDRTAVC